MTSALRRNLAFLAVAAALAILASCSSAASEQKLALLRVETPLREPVWVPERDVLLALDGDRRHLVRVDAGAASGSRVPVLAEEYEDMGENVVASHEDPGRAYLPRPGSGSLSVVDTRSLEPLRAYAAPGTPAYVTLDVQSEVLFAATEDRLVALRRETLEPEEVVEFGPLLEREGIDPGGISGIAVGTQHVYLTLEGEPYVLSVRKP